ncbi:hypothetical protein, partial [Escherichia coli]
MLPSEIMIWQPEFTDKILSRKPGAVHFIIKRHRSFPGGRLDCQPPTFYQAAGMGDTDTGVHRKK